MKKRLVQGFCALFAVLLMAGCGGAPAANSGSGSENQAAGTEPKTPANPDVILATTTSTQDTGLLDVLIPMFKEQTGYNVKPIAVGTGQALKMGEQGEADVLLVHAPDSEKPLVESGVAIDRKLVMHNDFIIVGPPEDPAGVKGSKDANEAMTKIANSGSIFVSRGDDSGTHKKELSVWKAVGIEPAGNSWYQETGAGMGQTLNVANEKRGYCLTDRGTYLSHQKNLDLDIVFEGDPILLNIYHVMVVNPEKFDKVNYEGAKAFADFLVADDTQKFIGEFGVDKYGQPLFFPDAGKSDEELGL